MSGSNERTHWTQKWTRQGPQQTPYAARPARDLTEVMTRDNGPDVTLSIEPTLVQSARTPKEMDKWKVTLLGPKGSTTVDYSMGVGHRRFVRGFSTGGDRLPAQPSAKEVLISLARDLRTLLDLPHDTEEAADTLASEFGYDKPSQAMGIVRALRKSADGLRKLLSPAGVGFEEFMEWCEELEAIPEPLRNTADAFRIALPVAVDAEGVARKCWVDVHTSQSKPGQRTVDGGILQETATKLTMTATLVEKPSDARRWRGDSMGQSQASIRALWADYPSVVKLCDILDRFHHNDMNPGSQAQMAVLATLTEKRDYDSACAALVKADLLVDRSVDGKPYRYGSAHLVEPLPDDVLQTLRELAEAIPTEVPVGPETPKLG